MCLNFFRAAQKDWRQSLLPCLAAASCYTLTHTPCTFLEHRLIAYAHTGACASLCVVCEAPGLSQMPLEYLAPPERAGDFPMTEFSSHG